MKFRRRPATGTVAPAAAKAPEPLPDVLPLGAKCERLVGMGTGDVSGWVRKGDVYQHPTDGRIVAKSTVTLPHSTPPPSSGMGEGKCDPHAIAAGIFGKRMGEFQSDKLSYIGKLAIVVEEMLQQKPLAPVKPNAGAEGPSDEAWRPDVVDVDSVKLAARYASTKNMLTYHGPEEMRHRAALHDIYNEGHTRGRSDSDARHEATVKAYERFVEWAREQHSKPSGDARAMARIKELEADLAKVPSLRAPPFR